MTIAFDRALAFTLDIEGGLSDRPGDRGGRTNRGITQATYDSWRDRQGLPRQPVDLITDLEVRAIYFGDYWTPCRCEELPGPLGAAVFDMAVNAGTWNAAHALQEALGVRVDGHLGVVTMTAAANAPDPLPRFLDAWAGHYADVVTTRPAQVENLHGWVNRLLRFQRAALTGGFS
jgi:lysozyme family protein